MSEKSFEELRRAAAGSEAEELFELGEYYFRKRDDECINLVRKSCGKVTCKCYGKIVAAVFG